MSFQRAAAKFLDAVQFEETAREAMRGVPVEGDEYADAELLWFDRQSFRRAAQLELEPFLAEGHPK